MAEHDDDAPNVEDGPNSNVMELLSEHVPLSLIVDLTAPTGPDSQNILTSEGVPEHSWWVQVGAEGPEADGPLQDEDEEGPAED